MRARVRGGERRLFPEGTRNSASTFGTYWHPLFSNPAPWVT